MDLRQLRYFAAVAEERHFGRAAARLHMAQPPLSQAIRRLEAGLGVALLRRSTRQVELTEAGAALLARSREILAAVDAAAAEAHRIGSGLVGRLAIGCVGSATYTLLPALARRLRDELPGVELAVHGEMLVPDLVAGLHDRTLDLALLRPTEDGAARPGLHVRRLRSERLVVAVPVDHRLAGRERLTVADLAGADLVVHASHGRSVMHEVVLRLCREAGFEPRVRHEVTETSTLVTFVAAGLGLAVVPEPVSALGVPGVTYRPLLAGAVRVHLDAATRQGQRAPHLERALDVLAALVADAPVTSEPGRSRCPVTDGA